MICFCEFIHISTYQSFVAFIECVYLCTRFGVVINYVIPDEANTLYEHINQHTRTPDRIPPRSPTPNAFDMSEKLLTQKETPRLHDLLDIPDIEHFRELFVSNSSFNPSELRQLLYNCGVAFTEDQFKTIFLRINTNRDNRCDWDEFISHLLNGFRDDDPYGQKEALNMPIESQPVIRKAIHRYPIVRVRFCPTVLPDRTVNNTNGSYITTSKDGTVIYWTQDFDMQRVCKSKNRKHAVNV